MSPKTLLDALTPEVIERLRQLELFSRYRVEGLLKGENRSILRGISTDFVSHRPYFPGEETRHIDWRVFARTDRLTIKQFEDLTTVHVAVAVDFSGSMAFGEGEPTKHHYAIHAAALVIYLAHLQRDRFSLHLFNDRLRESTPAGTGRMHLLKAFAALVANQPRGETSFSMPLMEIEASLKRRAILIVFSDCMAEPEAIARELLRFKLRGTDVICFQVFHPSERDFPYSQVSRFTCLETGAADNVDPLEIQRLYRENFTRHTRELETALRRRGMDHCALCADGDYETAVCDYLRRRQEILA